MLHIALMVKLDCNDTEIGNPNGAKHRILLAVRHQ